MTQANNIAVTLGWLAGSYKIANAEEMIVKSLKARVKDLPKEGILDLWYDMTNRKAKLNAGDWCSGAEIDEWKAALLEHEAVDAAEDIELMDEAGGPGDGDWVKIAAAAGTDIRDSAINGKGLFATRSFSPGDILITDFMQKQHTDDPRTRWEQSDSCRYTNHADKPNAFIRKLGETVELVADETIQPNEEITCNYRDASKTLGKAFFYTYRGKPYGNAPSEAAFMQKTAATLPDTFYGLPTFLKQSQTTDDILDRIANARSQTATEVSAGNAAAGNYRKGRFNYHGLRISIENPKGSVRSGTAADGTKWSNEMKSDYGYIRGTIGADGDPVDVFIGDDPKSELVFIVNQVNKSGSFDEHKVVLGVIDAKQARQTYLANYKPGWTGAGSVVGMTMPQFKEWLKGDVTKPAVAVKQAGWFDSLKIPGLSKPKPISQPLHVPQYEDSWHDPYGSDDSAVSHKLTYNQPIHAQLQDWERAGGVGADTSLPDHLVQAVQQYHRDSGHLPDYYEGEPDDVDLVELLMAMEAADPVAATKYANNRTAITPCDNPVQILLQAADTAAWREVPKQVARLMKSAADVKQQVQKAMEALPVADPGYGYVYWHPKRNHLWAVLSDSDEQDSHDAWWKALSKIPGINKVITEAEVGPHGEHKDEWIQIKKARVFTKNSTINPFTLAGKPFGGPNAVTNGVVGALIGGGLGYGGGRLAEMLLPERHFERGRLSKNLALAGAVLGGTPGLVQGVTHMGMNRDAGDPSAYRSWLQPTNAQKVAPNSTAWRKHVLGKMAGADPTPTQAAILRRSAKCAMATMSGLGNPGMRPINVDAFNNVIWHDPYSPPAVNAAAAGIVSGIQQHYGGASVLTPRHFIKGLAAAGVDAATATVAGGVLGVLGGLKPESQQTLQQMGLWSGLMRGSIGSIFGQ